MKLSEFKQLIKQSILEEKEKEKNASGAMSPEEEKMVADYEEEEANKHALDNERPLEEAMISPDNRVAYLVDALDHVWNMGKRNNPINFRDMAQSIINDMFGEEPMEEALLAEDNLEVRSIAKKLYSWLKQNGVAVSLESQNTNFKQIGIKDPMQKEASIAVFDHPRTKQTIIRVSLRGKESIVKNVEEKLLTTYPGLEQFNVQQNKAYSAGLTNPRELPGFINLHFDLKEKTSAKGGLVGNTRLKQKPMEEDVIAEAERIVTEWNSKEQL